MNLKHWYYVKCKSRANIYSFSKWRNTGYICVLYLYIVCIRAHSLAHTRIHIHAHTPIYTYGHGHAHTHTTHKERKRNSKQAVQQSTNHDTVPPPIYISIAYTILKEAHLLVYLFSFETMFLLQEIGHLLPFLTEINVASKAWSQKQEHSC